MLYKRLKSENIYLSPINIEQHLSYFMKWMNEDETILAFNGFHNRIYDYNTMKDTLEKWGNGAMLIVTNSNDIIGSISLFNVNHYVNCGEIGIFIEEKFQNQGYGNEAMKLMIEYAFNNLNFRYLLVNCYSHNEKAINIYKKLGFKEYGCLKDGGYYNGSFFNIHMLQLTRDNYQ